MKLREVTRKVIASLEEKSGYIVKVTEDPALPTLATDTKSYRLFEEWIAFEPARKNEWRRKTWLAA